MYEIRQFDGINFVKTPYRAGSYIREDLFIRQLLIHCHAQVSYDEDNRLYGRYWASTTLFLGECGLIEEAILLAQDRIMHQEIILPENAHEIQPQSIVITDCNGLTVLTGKVVSGAPQWCLPAQNHQEEAATLAEIEVLKSRWSEELRADNYDSMRHLNDLIRDLKGRLIHRFWNTHAIQALIATQ